MHETLTLAGTLERFLRKAADLSLRDVESLPYPARSPTGMKKKPTNAMINVKGTEIAVIRQEDEDFISLTDMLKAKDGDFFISDWLRNRNTIEFLGIWETVHNPNFNSGEFAIIKSQAGFGIQYRLWFTNTAANVQAVTGSQYGGTLVTAPALNDGQWHLLTLVNFLDGATWRTRVYHNDGTQFTQFNSGPSAPVAGLLRIGDTTLGGNGWNGQIDDLRIYRRALTQQEIATLYNPPPTYADWLRSSLTPAQLALPSFTDPNSDPDSDGSNNLLEFALGSHPNNSADIARPTFQRIGDTISFTYPRLRGNIQYLVQYSTDLEGWFTAGIDQDSITPIGQTAVATMTVPPGSERLFLRLRVMEP